MDDERAATETQQPAPPVKAAKKQGWLTRKLAGYYRSRDTVKAHPLWGTLFAIAAMVLGVAAHETYNYAKEKIFGPDQFLVQIRDEQQRNFNKIQDNLTKLRGAIDGKDQQALAEVTSNVKSLESNNGRLIDQLVMAKRENDNLRKIAEQRTGIAGGYDFILATDNGVRIDPTTVFGLRYVNNTAIGVSLSSRDSNESVQLASGQSIPYTNAEGHHCKVSLLGFDSDSKSASFAVGCAAT